MFEATDEMKVSFHLRSVKEGNVTFTSCSRFVQIKVHRPAKDKHPGHFKILLTKACV